MEYIILWVFALFGLWSLISNIVESIYSKNRECNVDIILNVHNQENTIELLLDELSKVEMIGKIIIYDNGSTDGTVDIVKKIQRNNKKVIFNETT